MIIYVHGGTGLYSFNENDHSLLSPEKGKNMLEITKQHRIVLLTCAELGLSADAPEYATLHSLRSLTTPFKENTITPP